MTSPRQMGTPVPASADYTGGNDALFQQIIKSKKIMIEKVDQ